MSKTFVTADSHFNHKNIIEYCSRPFTSVDEMNKTLIENWNAVVGKGDIVYHLGDFILGDVAGDVESLSEIISQLNGRIVLIRGNHDTSTKINLYNIYFGNKIVVKDIDHFAYKGLYFILCHFPIVNEEFQRLLTKHNSEIVLLHGHVHNEAPFYQKETHSFNCSVDVTDFTPISIDKIYKLIKQDFIKKNVWKEEF